MIRVTATQLPSEDTVRSRNSFYFEKLMNYIPTLTIAGSDSSGGAGIQADIKTMSALGCYAMSVITSITAQNTCGVRAVMPMPTELVRSQLEAVLDDIPPLAVKTGMLFNSEIIQCTSEVFSQLDIPLVVDPVMVATSGDRLIDEAAIEMLTKRLLPLSTLITPNLQEAEVLSGVTINSLASLEKAGSWFLSQGANAVLIKGGHTWENEATDYLFHGDSCDTFTHSRIKSQNTHGTGCTLSSAITSYLAQGYSLTQSVDFGKKYLSNALLSGKDVSIGHGHGPVDHFHAPVKSIKR